VDTRENVPDNEGMGVTTGPQKGKGSMRNVGRRWQLEKKNRRGTLYACGGKLDPTWSKGDWGGSVVGSK